jgi:hypothetical protein
MHMPPTFAQLNACERRLDPDNIRSWLPSFSSPSRSCPARRRSSTCERWRRRRTPTKSSRPVQISRKPSDTEIFEKNHSCVGARILAWLLRARSLLKDVAIDQQRKPLYFPYSPHTCTLHHHYNCYHLEKGSSGSRAPVMSATSACSRSLRSAWAQSTSCAVYAGRNRALAQRQDTHTQTQHAPD